MAKEGKRGEKIKGVEKERATGHLGGKGGRKKG